MIKRETKEKFISSEEYRVEVKILIFNTQEYNKGINLAFEWLNKINNEILNATINDMWAVNYYLGIGCWGLNRYKTAIVHLNNSLQHAVNSDVLNTMTMLGLCYLGMGNKDLALEMYKKSLLSCEDIKNMISDIRYLNTKASLLHNIGEILNEDIYYFESIKLYEELLKVGFIEVDETIKKIDVNYKHTIQLYITQNNYFKANNLLRKISSNEIVQELNYEIRNRMLGEFKIASIL